jgi:nitroimidazol reductase NimA-like FMN-containing flavoprotein (pyridoxamine 5'-phosphate oxidase superfamily)
MSDNQRPGKSSVRRKDREIREEGWIRELLHRGSYGVLGTSSAEQPFLTSLIYVYDEAEQAIYLHSAIQGRARSNVLANPNVCFTVSEIGRFLPAEVALEFSVEYSSVVIFGQCSVVSSNEEARNALQKHLDKYFPHLKASQDYRPITEDELRKTSVLKISIEEWSGKKKSEASDFPGAFHFPL